MEELEQFIYLRNVVFVDNGTKLDAIQWTNSVKYSFQVLFEKGSVNKYYLISWT